MAESTKTNNKPAKTYFKLEFKNDITTLPLTKQISEAERRLKLLSADCHQRNIMLSIAHMRYVLGLDDSLWREWLFEENGSKEDKPLLIKRRQMMQKWLLRAWVYACEQLSQSASGQKQIYTELARQAQEAKTKSAEDIPLSIEYFLATMDQEAE